VVEASADRSMTRGCIKRVSKRARPFSAAVLNGGFNALLRPSLRTQEQHNDEAVSFPLVVCLPGFEQSPLRHRDCPYNIDNLQIIPRHELGAEQFGFQGGSEMTCTRKGFIPLYSAELCADAGSASRLPGYYSTICHRQV
jgi:hypothetical protein